jgi:hypothetical protein
MFLKQLAWLTCIITGSAFAQMAAETEHQWTDDVVGSHTLQVGVDAWRINTSANEDTTANMNSLSRLQLANSYPVWHYRNPSEWLRFEGALRVGRDTLLSMKYRSDQSTGSRLDEASVDWAFHTYGVKFGVVDPKISWCRTYDVDSPWVRENNPFCSIQPLNFTKGSAPGAQAYANFIASDYSIQAIAGMYRPLWFNYAPHESPTITLASQSTITSHTKSGIALSATNLRNGTEFRFGILRDDFSSNRESINQSVPYNNAVHSEVKFIGANWYATPRIALRATYFTYAGHLTRTMRDSVSYVKLDQLSDYKATSLEANYQVNARDVMSISHVAYDFTSIPDNYALQSGVPVLISTYVGVPHFVTTNISMSWRRDWGGGFFTVAQFSKAMTDQHDASTNKHLSSDGRALGLRLGYRF